MCDNRLMTYNWQQKDWPEFRYDLSGLEDVLFSLAEKTGHVSGVLKGMPETMQTEAIIDLMVTEAVKTSEIEGEYISREDVMSSIRNQLGLNPELEQVRDQRARGAAQLMLAVRDDYAAPLTESMLFSWHSMLMEGNRRIAVGEWRTHEDPMQVVSGVMHKPKVHFEAPPSHDVPKEMLRFIQWFNDTAVGQVKEIRQSAVRSAIAHIYFETIHPFEDGNGRIGRAISEKALSQGLRRPVLLSLSKTIEANKKAYYDALEDAQKSNEITGWITYFVTMVLDAQNDAEILIDFILQKARFFDRFGDRLDDVHRKVINRMLAEGPKGFEGGMSAKKYISITGVSKATATRHLQYLTEIGAFIQEGSGRGTRYLVNLGT